ncbi:MAG: hypothetical protein ACJ73S_03415 [Mycobacteriales bacterium]
MKRTISRAGLTLVAGLTALLAMVATPAGAQTAHTAAAAPATPAAPALEGGNEPEGFPPCDAEHDGDVYVDGEDGQIWVCRFVPGAGWIWDPKLPPENATIAGLYGGFPQLGQAADGVADGDGGLTSVANLQVSDGNGNPLDQPAGWIAELVKFQFWNGSSWVICVDPGQFIFNAGQTSFLGVGWRFPSPPCGPGWYAAEADAWVWDGAAWRGGGQVANPFGIFVSGPEPRASSAPTEREPTRPAAVTAPTKPQQAPPRH